MNMGLSLLGSRLGCSGIWAGAGNAVVFGRTMPINNDIGTCCAEFSRHFCRFMLLYCDFVIQIEVPMISIGQLGQLMWVDDLISGEYEN